MIKLIVLAILISASCANAQLMRTGMTAQQLDDTLKLFPQVKLDSVTGYTRHYSNSRLAGIPGHFTVDMPNGYVDEVAWSSGMEPAPTATLQTFINDLITEYGQPQKSQDPQTISFFTSDSSVMNFSYIDKIQMLRIEDRTSSAMKRTTAEYKQAVEYGQRSIDSMQKLISAKNVKKKKK